VGIDLALERDSKAPVSLTASALAKHSAVLAQSGSGKSFMMGRLIEELLIKTKARVIIFDPNSDYARLNEINDKMWANQKCLPWFFPDDTHDRFRAAWTQVPCVIASNRNLPTAKRLTTDWGKLSEPEKAFVMNIDPNTDSYLYWCLFLSCRVSVESWIPEEDEYYDFDFFRVQCEQVVEFLLSGKGRKVIKDNPLAQTLRKSLNDQIALQFRAVVANLGEYEIWRSQGDGETDIADFVTTPDVAPQVLVIDLQSLVREEEKTAIVSRVLDALWTKGRNEQWEALRDYDSPDTRIPTFIVIDEAHNLVPQLKATPALESLCSKVVRIAAEGRKFGLHLIIATQRPRKVDSNILAECDNLFLMKMTNQSDMDFAEEAFGFLPTGAAHQAASLTTGELLLAGAVGQGLTIAHASPRRTLEGGRGIDESHWGVKGRV
jgi:hypothetical protein